MNRHATPKSIGIVDFAAGTGTESGSFEGQISLNK
jgi:hypothetical protein